MLFVCSGPPCLHVSRNARQARTVALRTTGVTGHRLLIVQCRTSVPSGKKKKKGDCQMAKRLLPRLRTLGWHLMGGTSLPPEILRLQATCHPRSSRSLGHVREVVVPPMAAVSAAMCNAARGMPCGKPTWLCRRYRRCKCHSPWPPPMVASVASAIAGSASFPISTGHKLDAIT